MASKKKLQAEIDRLNGEIEELDDDHSRLSSEYYAKCREVQRNSEVPEKVKYSKAGSLSFDFWPPSDWFRLSFDTWNPGMYSQLCVGPIRLDFYAS